MNKINKIGLLSAGLLALTLTAQATDGSSISQKVRNLVTLNSGAEAAARPNILLIMADDQAKHALSCYGNKDIQTPALDRLAGEGMRFNHALTPNSFCTPSRAVVLTGKYSHKNGVLRLNKPFDGSQQTFPKLLQGAGYETAVFGKWHLLTRPTGFDYYCVMKMQGMVTDPMVFEPQHDWVVWSKETRKDKSYNKGGRTLKGYNNEALTTEAINWLKEKRDPNKPFCLLLHPKPPHAPYDPPKKYEDFLKDVLIPEPVTLLDDYKGRAPETIQKKMASNRIILAPSFRKLRKQLEKDNPGISRDDLLRAMYQEYIKGYYRLVKSVDDNVGRVLDYLKESGLEKNTLVIFTSDQGFSLGEHGMYNKMWMYESALHQPLLVRLPGVIEAGTVHDSLVNHVDLAPTLLDFAGLPIPDDIQGYSLKPILEGKAEKVRDASYYHFYEAGTGLPEMVGIRTERYKLIHYPGLDEAHQFEVFDLKNDSDEMINQYHNPEFKEIVQKLKTGLRDLIEKHDDPVELPNL
jgi:arylsulfatase A-like enzyme